MDLGQQETVAIRAAGHHRLADNMVRTKMESPVLARVHVNGGDAVMVPAPFRAGAELGHAVTVTDVARVDHGKLVVTVGHEFLMQGIARRIHHVTAQLFG